MQLVDAIHTGAIHLPWPISVSGEMFDGQQMHISGVCQRKCGNDPVCATLVVEKAENVCANGMSFFRANVRENVITIFGVRGEGNPNASKQHIKDALKGRSITVPQIEVWVGHTESLMKAIDNEFLRRQSELLDPLHDPIKLGRQIENIANRLVNTDPSKSLEDQIERASPDLKSLVKAAGLLSDSFDLLTIYFNPDAASFGRKTYISIHGLLIKLVSILSNPDSADENHNSVRIFINGSCYRKISVYESFKLVPFALISNAVKYSADGKVRVNLTDRAGVVEVSVESVGPPIEPDELESIFSKRVRGKWAEKVADGSGVGLYLAKIVADANGFAIRVTSVKQNGSQSKDRPLAINRFSFEISAFS